MKYSILLLLPLLTLGSGKVNAQGERACNEAKKLDYCLPCVTDEVNNRCNFCWNVDKEQKLQSCENCRKGSENYQKCWVHHFPEQKTFNVTVDGKGLLKPAGSNERPVLYSFHIGGRKFDCNGFSCPVNSSYNPGKVQVRFLIDPNSAQKTTCTQEAEDKYKAYCTGTLDKISQGSEVKATVDIYAPGCPCTFE